jgi:L-threonylcarbamoyladenylate synthase
MKITLGKAAALIKKGDVVAVPTETVYGLAASLQHKKAIREIFSLKGRPGDNPLIVHISRLSQLKNLVASVPPHFHKLKKFWPGPLTIVFLANKKTVPSWVRAGLNTVAIRMPRHKTLLQLIDKTGPLAAPSANISGRPSPTKRSHVEDDLGLDFPVLDGGICRLGVESTVIDLHQDSFTILRPGALSAEKIAQKLKDMGRGRPSLSARGGCLPGKPLSPGQKYQHYAPRAQLFLCKSRDLFTKKFSSGHFEAVLGFDDSVGGSCFLSLGRRDHFSKNLKNLYAQLRELDRLKLKKVLVDADFSHEGLGNTLWERLSKASGGR